MVKQSVKKGKNFFKTIFYTLIIFGFIYEVQPIGVPDILTSRKIVFFIAFFIFAIKSNFVLSRRLDYLTRKIIIRLFIISICILLWTAILTLIYSLSSSVSGTSILSRTLLFVLYVPLFCLFMLYVFDNTDQFVMALLFATLLQCVIVFLDFFLEPVRVFLFEHFVLYTNFSYMTTYRAAGLGAGESLLSVDLFLGIIACSYLILHHRFGSIYIIPACVILFASALVAATGFLIGLLTIMASLVYWIVFVRSKMKFINKMLLSALIVLIVFLLPNLINAVISSNKNFQIFNKIMNLSSTGIFNSSTMQSLEGQVKAPICFETIVGTGLYRGTIENDIVCNSDSGYIQAYFGYGLIAVILFYGTLYINMFKTVLYCRQRTRKHLMLFVLIIMIVIEYKEPYIHNFVVPFVFYLMCLLPDSNQERGSTLRVYSSKHFITK